MINAILMCIIKIGYYEIYEIITLHSHNLFGYSSYILLLQAVIAYKYIVRLSATHIASIQMTIRYILCKK